ncbi:MAG: alpha/beta fold hydrolase [Planctomycetota bacterium]
MTAGTGNPRFDALPASLKTTSTLRRLAGVPAMVTLPAEDARPAGGVVWMHGRTAHKEIDNGRFLRLMRAGYASVALDLPGHGQRAEPGREHHDRTPGVLLEMLEELPGVIDAVRSDVPEIDADRLVIGGMSAGGMVAARACCDAHPFLGLAMESSTGWLRKLYSMDIEDADGPRGARSHSDEIVARVDAMAALEERRLDWRTVPVLALHSAIDRTVPLACQTGFLDRVRSVYRERGDDPGLVELKTWPETGAPYEHAGFGRVAGEAKSVFLDFCRRAIG